MPKHPVKFLSFIEVTLPLYPPPLIREGEFVYIREASPLFNSPYFRAVIEGSLKRLNPF